MGGTDPLQRWGWTVFGRSPAVMSKGAARNDPSEPRRRALVHDAPSAATGLRPGDNTRPVGGGRASPGSHSRGTPWEPSAKRFPRRQHHSRHEVEDGRNPHRGGPQPGAEARATYGPTAEIDTGAAGRGPPTTGRALAELARSYHVGKSTISQFTNSVNAFSEK
jgi:hypothetical protein